MSESPITLVCFAVREEAGAFQQSARNRPGIQVLITGMGRRNAESALRRGLATVRPVLVVTSGFAGGLQPGLAAGTVLFATDEPGLQQALLSTGARPARFHCSERIAVTASEKRELNTASGADAVEMESEAICAVCREQRIPSAIVRVVLDTAEEDLPLDFNRLLDAGHALDAGKLALAIAKSPGAIPGLLRLRRRSRVMAQKLAGVLAQALLGPRSNNQAAG